MTHASRVLIALMDACLWLALRLLPEPAVDRMLDGPRPRR